MDSLSNLALSGVKVAEILLRTAQNNIANAENTSYARQSVNVKTEDIIQGKGLLSQLGSGARVQEIIRITDDLLIHQTRNLSSDIGRQESIRTLLSSIEVAFHELGDDGISKLMKNFYNSFANAAKFPEQSSYRENILSESEVLINKFKTTMDSLSSSKGEVKNRIDTEVHNINELTKKIAELNEKIQKSGETNPNALLDERDRYIDQISNFIDIKVINKTNLGEMEIKVGNVSLVSGKHARDIVVNSTSENNELFLSVGSNELFIQNGSLMGLFNVNENINHYEERINLFAATFIEQVNTLHTSGYGLNNSTGLNFFEGKDARTIAINEVLKKDKSNIALSSEEGVIGNSEIANAISQIQFDKVIQEQTLDDFYQDFVIEMANDLNNAKRSENITRNIFSEMQMQRQSVQGVNIDDELINLQQYQYFYQANAKTLNIANQLMKELFTII